MKILRKQLISTDKLVMALVDVNNITDLRNIVKSYYADTWHGKKSLTLGRDLIKEWQDNMQQNDEYILGVHKLAYLLLQDLNIDCVKK